MSNRLVAEMSAEVPEVQARAKDPTDTQGVYISSIATAFDWTESLVMQEGRLQDEEEWAARKLQALEKGRQARQAFKEKGRSDFGTIARQAKLLTSAAKKFQNLKPLEGKLLQGGFPGAPVNASIQLALAPPPASHKATCYESGRDAVLRFFVRYTRFFTWLAVLLAVAFVLDILVLIVFFWGAVFGVGIMGMRCRVHAFNPRSARTRS